MSEGWTQVPPGVTLEGKVNFDFAGDGDYQLKLRAGDDVVIMFESTNGWLKGYVKGKEEKHGIFPTNFVTLEDYVYESDADPDNISSAHVAAGKPDSEASLQQASNRDNNGREYSDESLLKEVKMTIREWEREMRVSVMRGQGDVKYHQLKNRIGAIMQHASVLRAAGAGVIGSASGSTSSASAKPEAVAAAKESARESIIKLLEVNRRTRAGFLVPRTEQGELAVLDNTSLVRLYEMHCEMQVDLHDAAHVADRLSPQELAMIKIKSSGGRDEQLLQKAKAVASIAPSSRNASKQAKATAKLHADASCGRKHRGASVSDKAKAVNSARAQRLASLCQLKLSYEVAMLSVGEPLELYFSIYCTGVAACKQFDLAAPLTANEAVKGSAAGVVGSQDGWADSHGGFTRQKSDDFISAGMSLNDVYNSAGTKTVPVGAGMTGVGGVRGIIRGRGGTNSAVNLRAGADHLVKVPASSGFFLSEEFLVSVTEKGLPSDATLIGKIGTMFRDIERAEVLGGIYLVCRVYRIGVLESSQKDGKKSHGIFKRSSNNTTTSLERPHRRPYGVACFDLTSNISNLENIDWSPPPLTIYTTRAKDAIETRFSTLHLNIIDNKLDDLEVAPRCRGVIVKMHMDSGGAPLSILESAAGAVEAEEIEDSLVKTKSTSKNKSNNRESELEVTAETPRTCFGSLVDPSQPRDDLYVTLLDGTFSKDGKRAQKNVGIIVYAISNDGTHVPCLSRGTTNLGSRSTAPGSDAGSHQLDSSYHATIFYHNGTPHYDETLRVDLSAPGASKAHLLFLFSHCSSKHSKTQVFGFGYLPLSDVTSEKGGPVLSDGIRIITTYMPTPSMMSMGKAEMSGKIGLVTSMSLNPMTTYLAKNRRTNPPVARRDTFRIATRLCSNKSTQIRNLRDLLSITVPLAPDTARLARQEGREVLADDLNVEEEREAEVAKILERVTYVDSAYVAVYISGIFDQLFKLLAEEYISLDLQREVFSVIIQCVNRLAGKRSNPGHTEALDIYISEVFHSQSILVYKIIVDQATELIDWLDRIDPSAPLNQDGAKKRRTLNNMMRSFQYVVKFATTAGLEAISLVPEDEAKAKKELTDRFKHSLQQLMYYVDNLMLKQAPTFVRVIQDLAIENFTPVFEHLQHTFDQGELGEIARGFIESVPHDETQRVSLRMKKLLMVHAMMQSSCGIFTEASSRAMCIAPVVRMLQEFLHSHRPGERILTVLILKDLVQITHDAKSTDDAWNLSCMLLEITQFVATLMEEKKAASDPQQMIAQDAIAGASSVLSNGDRQEAGNAKSASKDNGEEVNTTRRVSIVGMPTIAHGRKGQHGNNRLLRATSIASRLATSTGTKVVSKTKTKGKGPNSDTIVKGRIAQSTSEYAIDTLKTLPAGVRDSVDLLKHSVVSLFEIIRMMTERQKKYFLSAITKTHRMRFEFFANLLHISHRMLANLGPEQHVHNQTSSKGGIMSSQMSEGMPIIGARAGSGNKGMFPSLWLVMCIGEHKSQLAILKWFSDMAADEYLFDADGVEAEQRIAAGVEKDETVEHGDSIDDNRSQEKDELLSAELGSGLLDEFGMPMVEEVGYDDGDDFSGEGNAQVSHMEKLTLWDGFMWLGVTLLNAPNLTLEQMPGPKRDFTESNFGDMRDTVCDILVFLWEKLGNRKLTVIDQLSLPLLRLTDSGHARTREFGSATYFDMLRTEYAESQSLQMVENATIDAVTSIVAERNEKMVHELTGVSGKSPGEGFLELFTNQLEQKFRDDEQLRANEKLGAEFLGGIKELFDLLSTLSRYERSADSTVFEDERTASMLKLMVYLKEKSRIDMYMHSIQRLRALHLGLGNYVEAAHVLLLAIDDASEEKKRLDENNRSLVSSRSLLGIDTEWSLVAKSPVLGIDEIVLIEAAISLYKKGNDWQSALRHLQRLRVHYEQGTYEFNKLAEVLEEQASLYRHVQTAEIYHCSHFRVAFRGLKWDKENANKVFIYRGGPLESIMEFIARIKRKVPECEMVSAGKETPEMDKDEEKCYLQVSSVKPAFKEAWDNHEPNFPSSAPKNVLSYRLNYNVNIFTLQMPFRVKVFHGKPKAKSKNEFMDLWSRTILMRTAESLPTTIRRSEIKEIKEIMMNPLEVAVRTVRDKNEDLKEKIAQADLLKVRNAPQSFTMAINGTVDAAVNGGLANYAPFLTGSYKKENPEIVEDMEKYPEKLKLIGELRALMESHLVILKRGVEVHARVCDEHMLPLHEIIIKKFPLLLESCQELGVKVPQWS